MKKISIYIENFIQFDSARKHLPEGIAWSAFTGMGCGTENLAPKGLFKAEIICEDERCEECIEALINLFKVEDTGELNVARPEGQDQGVITVETIDNFIKIKDHTNWNT